MELKTKERLAGIRKMTTNQMREKYVEIFNEQTRSCNRQWMLRRIAWRLQSLDEGSLSSRGIRRARELACEQDIRVIPPSARASKLPVDRSLSVPQSFNTRDPRLPLPGQVISRKYKGYAYLVTVLHNGFEFDGKVYRSLSAIARAITGSCWNGYYFFNLTKDNDQ